MALNTVSSDRLSTNVKNTNFTAAEKQDLTDDILPLAGELGNRNKLINGGMSVSQRGTSFTTGDNAEHFSADRWVLYAQNTGSRFTITQSTDTPDGFGNSLKIDCTTADTSLASNEEVQFYQKVEGFNTQDFAKGTSAAKQYTLSFYVKTNKTGTYIVRLLGRDNTTSHVAASYTVSDTNWNRYTLTFPADTTSGRGDNNDNGEALRVVWWLVAGSAVNSGSLQTTWANSSDTGAATGQVNFADSTSNDFFITGCQLEVGSVATDFEHRSFGQEVALCERYCQAVLDGSDANNSGQHDIVGHTYTANNVFVIPRTRTKMRAAPSISTNTGSFYYNVFSQGSSVYFDSIGLDRSSTNSATIAVTTPSGGSIAQGLPCFVRTNNTNAKILLIAEL